MKNLAWGGGGLRWSLIAWAAVLAGRLGGRPRWSLGRPSSLVAWAAVLAGRLGGCLGQSREEARFAEGGPAPCGGGAQGEWVRKMSEERGIDVFVIHSWTKARDTLVDQGA